MKTRQRLVGGLVGWLVGWWVGGLVGWLVGGLVGWLVGYALGFQTPAEVWCLIGGIFVGLQIPNLRRWPWMYRDTSQSCGDSFLNHEIWILSFNNQDSMESILYIPGWWFQTFFIFTPTWGHDPM